MFIWKNLDSRTRELMEAEVNDDHAAGRVYMSKRFTPTGEANYVKHLLDAIRTGTEQMLATALRQPSYFKSRAAQGMRSAAVPVTAPDTFAEGEFNRYYMRAICVRAEQDEIEEIIVYRAKSVSAPRLESEVMIGRGISPDRLLRELRSNLGGEIATGLPKPNSGLSVHLP